MEIGESKVIKEKAQVFAQSIQNNAWSELGDRGLHFVGGVNGASCSATKSKYK